MTVGVASIEIKSIVSGVTVSAAVGLETEGGVQVDGSRNGVAVGNNSDGFVGKAVQADNKIVRANTAIWDLVFIASFLP